MVPLSKFLFQSVFIFLLCIGAGCGHRSHEELSRAQQEIDTRQYEKAISRLELLAETDSSVLGSELYVDLLSSAYLGGAGLDLIRVLARWSNRYRTFAFLQTPNQQSLDKTIPITLESFKRLTDDLFPREINSSAATYLNLALELCNKELLLMSEKRDPAFLSKRVLLKTLFVNFLEILSELKNEMLPGVDQMIRNSNRRAELCLGFDRSKGSLARMLPFSTHLALAGSLLTGQDSAHIENILNLNKFATSFKWVNEFSVCEQISDEDLEKIKRRFTTLQNHI